MHTTENTAQSTPPQLRTKVISLKLTNKEYFDLVRLAEGKYGLPPSTVVYLLTKEALHNYDDTRHQDMGIL